MAPFDLVLSFPIDNITNQVVYESTDGADYKYYERISSFKTKAHGNGTQCSTYLLDLNGGTIYTYRPKHSLARWGYLSSSKNLDMISKWNAMHEQKGDVFPNHGIVTLNSFIPNLNARTITVGITPIASVPTNTRITLIDKKYLYYLNYSVVNSTKPTYYMELLSNENANVKIRFTERGGLQLITSTALTINQPYIFTFTVNDNTFTNDYVNTANARIRTAYNTATAASSVAPDLHTSLGEWKSIFTLFDPTTE